MSSTVSDLNIYKDFEIIWVDRPTAIPKDMDDVTLEIYHYSQAQPGQITAPLQEPYIFTETANDSVNIGSLCTSTSGGFAIDVHFTLELNLVNDQLEGLNCPANEYVVPGTTEKVAIVNGIKQYALSACELAALVNLEASGYVASSENGFLVLKSDFAGSDCCLQVGNGSWNCVLGLVEGDQYCGQDLQKNIVVGPKNMIWVATGTYVCLHVPVTNPSFVKGERYFALYRGNDPITGSPEISQEDFTVLLGGGIGGSTLTFSFLK
ncbi:hypothetical protein N9948_01520 [bacterium]|nr:hypothetical protein [bacterium]